MQTNNAIFGQASGQVTERNLLGLLSNQMRAGKPVSPEAALSRFFGVATERITEVATELERRGHVRSVRLSYREWGWEITPAGEFVAALS